MATYAAKLRQEQGTGTASINSSGQLQLIKGGNVWSIAEFRSGSTDVDADVTAIPLTATLVKKTTGNDAEALTLANGTPGQIININLVTDGNGDGTLTPTTKSGFVSIVFADAGDAATLMYVDDTVGWIILGCYGATAQPTINLS